MSAEDKAEIAAAVNDIWEILRALPSPRAAAKAIAGVHVMLMEQGGAQNEKHVRAMLRDVDQAVLESWSKRAGIPRAH